MKNLLIWKSYMCLIRLHESWHRIKELMHPKRRLTQDEEKESALAAVLLAIGLTACGNNNSQVSADATQNMQIESSVETENTNNTEEAEQTVTSEDASNATDEIVEDTSSEATKSSEDSDLLLFV
ncbi:MAG: hypothetical protein E7302_15690 [Butyrivibrio sp.]|nr:hypothetical protein [Butyrivibrio sp.]